MRSLGHNVSVHWDGRILTIIQDEGAPNEARVTLSEIEQVHLIDFVEDIVNDRVAPGTKLQPKINLSALPQNPLTVK